MVRASTGRIAIETVGFRDVHLTTNDRFDSGFLCSLIKSNRAEEITVIRNGDCRHFVLRRGLRQRIVIARAIEKTESGMKMEMNKTRHLFMAAPYIEAARYRACASRRACIVYGCGLSALRFARSAHLFPFD